jgi:ubiquinone/menaquinone biosynthesis C-methylase UbiE
MNSPKEAVREYWDTTPCGAQDMLGKDPHTRAYFEEVERQRYAGDDFMPDVVDFGAFRGKRVLEVGCGLGTDLRQFAKAGAIVTGLDLSSKSLALARKGFDFFGLEGTFVQGDGETLPFDDASFDVVYSWGVIHHSPDPPAVVREIHRVLKPGGQILAMVYHARSLLVLQAWVYWGLLRGNSRANAREIVAGHVESPGTKVYTRAEARRLFGTFEDVDVEPIMTRFDLRLGRRLFLPKWTRRVVPDRMGWFLVVRGRKSAPPADYQ